MSQSKLKAKPWWDYPRFAENRSRVLLVSLNHLLLSEIRNALGRLGHASHILLLPAGELAWGAVERAIKAALNHFRPDFLLTVNHLGFDQEGMVTHLLEGYRIPFASWYVDSPTLTLGHYAGNHSPFQMIFLWDRDYVPALRSLGFENIEYLPLGVDDRLFQPEAAGGAANGESPWRVCFVGNSMIGKTRSKLLASGARGPLLQRFGEVAGAFAYSRHLMVGDMLDQSFPDLACLLAQLPSRRACAYETSATWQATAIYRCALIRGLAAFKPLIAGDSGWREILGQGFQTRGELNYYDDLPAFYGQNDLHFNATSRQMKQGVNQRVFDVPATRRALVTDWTPQLEDLMEPGREIFAYRDGQDLPDVMTRAVEDAALRRKVAAAGYRRVKSQHTYAHRIARLVESMRVRYG